MSYDGCVFVFSLQSTHTQSLNSSNLIPQIVNLLIVIAQKKRICLCAVLIRAAYKRISSQTHTFAHRSSSKNFVILSKIYIQCLQITARSLALLWWNQCPFTRVNTHIFAYTFVCQMCPFSPSVAIIAISYLRTFKTVRISSTGF